MPETSADTRLRTPAWQLIGLTRSEPGVLTLNKGLLSFETDAGRLFALPLSEVSDVVFPWYYFGGGVKFTAGTEPYRLSFVQPNDADDLSGRLLARSQDGGPAALFVAGQKMKDIGEGRSAGKAWKAILLP